MFQEHECIGPKSIVFFIFYNDNVGIFLCCHSRVYLHFVIYGEVRQLQEAANERLLSA